MRHSRRALTLAILGSGLFGTAARADEAEGYVRFIAGHGLTPVSALSSASEAEGVVRLPQAAPLLGAPVLAPPPLAPAELEDTGLENAHTEKAAPAGPQALPVPLAQPVAAQPVAIQPVAIQPVLVQPVQPVPGPPAAPPLAFVQPVAIPPVAIQPAAVPSTAIPSVANEPHLILSPTHATDTSRKPAWGRLPLALASPRLDAVLPTLHPADIRTGLAGGRGLSRLPSLDLASSGDLAGKPAVAAAPVAVAPPVRTENSLQIARTEPALLSPAASGRSSQATPELIFELRRAAEDAVREKPLVAETVDGPRTRPRGPVDGIGTGELAIVTAPRSGKDLGLEPRGGFQSGNTAIGLRVAQAEPAPSPQAAPIEKGTDGPMPSRREPARARTESEIAAMLRAPVAEISIDDPTQDPETANERPDSLAAKYAAPGIFVSNWTWPEPRHQRYTYPFYHTPLYFEDANLERCGLGYGVFQPWVSSGRFIGQTFLWPASMVHRCPYEHVLSPGDCRTCEKFKHNTTSAK